MLVCHRWRDLCLDNAQLWSFIGPDHKAPGLVRINGSFSPGRLTIEDRVKRSGQSPLTCQFDLSYSKNVDKLLTVLNGNSRRVHSLCLSGPAAALGKVLNNESDLPALKDLKINYEDLWMNSPDAVPDYWTFPGLLAETIGPRLRVVHLANVQFSSPSSTFNLLTDMTSLDLSNIEDIHTALLPSLQDVLSVIARSPRLVQLRMVKYWRDTLVDVHATEVLSHSISLPHLQSLSVTAKTAHITFFLQSLDIPPTSSLRLLLLDARDGSSIRRFVVPLRRHLHRKNTPLIDTIALKYIPKRHRDHLLSFKVYTGDQSHRSYLHKEHGAYLRIETLPSRAKYMRDILRKLLHMLPIQPANDVKVFWDNDYDNQNVTLWMALWRALPPPRTVTLREADESQGMMDGLLNVLQSGGQGISGRRLRRYSRDLPRPSTLHVMSLYPDFCEFEDDDDIEEYRYRYDLIVEWLRQFRAVEFPSKKKGIEWKRVEFEKVYGEKEQAALKEYWSRLAEVAETLRYSGTADGDLDF